MFRLYIEITSVVEITSVKCTARYLLGSFQLFVFVKTAYFPLWKVFVINPLQWKFFILNYFNFLEIFMFYNLTPSFWERLRKVIYKRIDARINPSRTQRFSPETEKNSYEKGRIFYLRDKRKTLLDELKNLDSMCLLEKPLYDDI